MKRNKPGPDSSAVAFRYKGKKLVGVFTLPGGSSRRRVPGVLFLHGFPGSEMNVDVARALAHQGVASFSLHFAGAWGSEGIYRVSTLVDQARAGLRYLARCPSVNPKRLAVFGFSMGGWAAINLGPRVPVLKGIVAIAPAAAPEILHPAFTGFIKECSRILDLGNLPASIKDLKAAVSAGDPVRCVVAMKPPLLLVHGADDDTVPIAVSDRIYAAARGKTEYLKSKGSGHSFSDRRPWLVRRTTAWLVRKLKA